ncbi:MAG: hypothetical protein ACTSXT_13815 [Candidatus Helarchaeota archaeon]
MWKEVYDNVKQMLAERKPERYILSTIQNRMDMQNTYMDLRSLTHFLRFLEQKVGEEEAIASGETSGEGGLFSSIGGIGGYSG